MKALSLILIAAGLLIVIAAFRKSPVSLRPHVDEYFKSRLIHGNVVNLLLLYIAVPLFLFFADPFGIKFYTVNLNAELLACYHLMIIHSFFAGITTDHVFICLILSAMFDLILFAACSLLSLVIFRGWKSIVMNFILFYLVLILLNLLCF